MDLSFAIFYTKSIEEIVRFYNDVLGLDLEEKSEGFASFIFPNGAKLGIKKKDEEREIPGAQTVILSVDNVEKLYSTLKSSVKIYKELTEESWGKNFSILDPDNNKVEFVEKN